MKVSQKPNLEHLTEVRNILEPEIAALAAKRASESEIAALQAAVENMDLNLQNADAFIAADNDFHRALAKATQNILILALVDSIVSLLSEQRKLIFTIDGGPERGQLHHKQILHAITSHDSGAASKAMLAHLQQVREDTGAAI
jgi:DNA-binding FadR family transcriptional regulator